MEDMFFIKGHTKNACDRMLNLLNIDLHLHNIYCFEDMVHYLDENEHIYVEPIASDEFFDFHRLLNSVYRTPDMGQTNITNVFKTCSSLPKTLQKQDVVDSDVLFNSLLPTKRNSNAVKRTPEELEGRILTMLSGLVVLEPQGMREIKQVEMFTKRRPIIPEK